MHFALAGYVCPPLYNPSDFCMDLISVDVRGERNMERSTARVKGLIQHWQSQREKLDAIAELDEKTQPLVLDEHSKYTPIYIALPVILERTFKNTWRQPDLFWTRFVE